MVINTELLISELRKLRQYRIEVRVTRSQIRDRDGDHGFFLTDDYIKVQDLDKVLKEFE